MSIAPCGVDKIARIHDGACRPAHRCSLHDVPLFELQSSQAAVPGFSVARFALGSESNLVALMAAAERGGKPAADALFGALYAELRRLASYELARRGAPISLSATTLLHKAYIQIAGVDGTSFPDRSRFMGYAARVMRGLIIDHVRSRHAQKRGGRFEITSLQTEAEDRLDETKLIQIGGALEELAEVESALAEIVDLRFFCGLTFAEIAVLRGVSERTVQRQWEKARIYLRCRIQTNLDL
jgi:RNA polymerase sigma factor (TIGR02999 family)